MNLAEANGTRYSAWAVTAILVVFLWLAPIFWKEVELSRGEIAESFENSELYQFVYPVLDYAFGRMRTGDVPLWNPNQLCGTPIHADPRLGLFQPLNMPLLLLPTHQAMALQSLLCLAVMGAGFALFMRGLGVQYVPAVLGGVIYAFCGASAAAMSRPGPASALAWMPYGFWCIHEFVRSGRRYHAVLSGLVLGLLGLSGAYALVVAAAFVLVPFLVLGTAAAPREPGTRRSAWMVGWGILAAVGVSVAAVQWAPTAAWLHELDRPESAGWSLMIDAHAPVSPRALAAQLMMCRSGTLPRIGYIGIGTLLLLPAAFFHWPRRREVVFFLVVALLLLGVYVFRWNCLPMGFPSHALVYMLVFCVATLAAIGMDRLLIRPRAPRIPAVWPPGVLVLVCSSVLFYFAAAQIRGYILAFVCLLVPALILRYGIVRAISGILLALFVYIDLTAASVNAYRHPFTEAPQCYSRYGDAVAAAKSLAGESRVVVSARDLDSALPENLGMLFPVASIGGAHLLLARDEAAWWNRLTDTDAPLVRSSGKGIRWDCAAPRLINYMAGRVVIAAPGGALYEGRWDHPGGPRLTLTRTVGDVRIFVNQDALPRAYWVPGWRGGYEAADAVDVLADRGFDPRRECLLDREPRFDAAVSSEPNSPVLDNPLAESSAHGTGVCEIEASGAERVVVRVDAPQPGITVLADRYAPGWIAYIDGNPVPILRANGLFRGIATPSGSHVIEFIYRPRAFVIGAGVTVAGLVLAVALALSDVLGRVRGPSAALGR